MSAVCLLDMRSSIGLTLRCTGVPQRMSMGDQTGSAPSSFHSTNGRPLPGLAQVMMMGMQCQVYLAKC